MILHTFADKIVFSILNKVVYGYLEIKTFSGHILKFGNPDQKLKVILKIKNPALNFNLIKGDTNEKYSLYSSHSSWNSKEDFINWTKSDAFRLAHKNAAQHRDLYLGPPDFEGFEVVF